MTRISRSALVEVPIELAYQVVVDVERYPEFVPGCDEVKVLTRRDQGLDARVTVTGAGMTQSFVTRNQHNAGSITMVLTEGPLDHLQGVWHFNAIGEAGCRVEIDIDFAAGGVLATLFTPVADKVANRLVDAFVERMDSLSGHTMAGQ